MKKIAITPLSFCRSEELVATVQALGLEIHLNTSGQQFNEKGLVAFLQETSAEILLLGTDRCSAAVLSQVPHLRYIAKYGVGLDNIDFAAAKAHKIEVGFSQGVNRRSVSELVLGFVLGHARNVTTSIARMRAGVWLKEGGYELSGKTVGIVGFGHVGSDLASLLAPFRCTVLCCDVLDKSVEARTLGATQVPYDVLLARSDIISFHVPGTPATQRMLGANELLLVKPHALIVNTARGTIVDFTAVVAAAQENRIGGYAADVFDAEPCNVSALAASTNLYFTPHIGGNSREAVYAMGEAAISHVRTYLQNAGCL